jgi:hypothetical protein
VGSSVSLSGSLGSIGPVSMNPVTVDGIPDHFTIDVNSIPKITLGIDPVTLNPVEATLTLKPVDLNISVKELPETRTHLPADFNIGLSLLGLQLLCLRICGEAQMISEAYRPNPCEHCGDTVVGRVADHG